MKTKEVIKKIRKAAKAAGVDFSTEQGANHTLLIVGPKKTTIGRHTETSNLFAEKVYKQLEEVLGEGWWQ